MLEVKDRIKKWIAVNDGKYVFIATAITAFVEYFYYFLLEPMHSDIYAEGLLKYSGLTRCITLNCWSELLYYKLTSCVVHPWFEHVVYTVCVAIAAICINEMWHITTRTMRVLSGMLLMSAPAITGQILYIYTYHSYGLAFLLAVLSVYLLWYSDDRRMIIPAAIMMSISLGFESIYLGAVIFLVAGCLLTGLIRKRDLKFRTFVSYAVRAIVFGVAGVALFWGIAKIFQAIFHESTAQYAGAEKVGIINTVKNIPVYIKSTYRQFAAYYRDAKLGGEVFWGILIAIAMICIVFHLIFMIRDKNYWNAVAAFGLVMCIPAGANIMLIILPEHGMQLHWKYQMQLMGPLCIAIIGITAEKMCRTAFGIIYILTAACLAGLIVSYGFCAYSSFRTLDIGSRHIKLYVQNAITHAIEDEEYIDGMPIVFAGFVNDDPVQEENPLREYSYYERAYPFWRDRYEVFSVWPRYCWYNFGIDIGRVSPEQYESILASDRFKTMEQYPSNKAYAIIDGCYVILLDRESVQ